MQDQNCNASLYALMSEVAEFYHQELFKSEKALAYWQDKRKFSEGTIRHFKLGYAPKDQDSFLARFRKERRLLKKLELIFLGRNCLDPNPRKKYTFVRFRNNLMIPFTDCIPNIGERQVIGFTGRTFEEEQPDEHIPGKYVNTLSSPIFNQGSFLFNWLEARKAALREGKLVVFEGPTSHISAWQQGFAYTTALCGTCLNPERMQKIRRELPNTEIIICI